jgi:hypothetical protein
MSVLALTLFVLALTPLVLVLTPFVLVDDWPFQRTPLHSRIAKHGEIKTGVDVRLDLDVGDGL